MLQGLGDLAAITGEKLSYWLPASVADKVGASKNNIAFCAQDGDNLLRYVAYEALKAERKTAQATRVAELTTQRVDDPTSGLTAEGRKLWDTDPAFRKRIEDAFAKGKKRSENLIKRRAKAGGNLGDFAKDLEQELAKLRRNGVTGPIPVCIHRTTGQRGADLPRSHRRSNVIHEDFHANVRRAEHKLGRKYMECSGNVPALLGDDLSPELLAFSRSNWAATPANSRAAEEILARVEEMRMSCKRSNEDCIETAQRIGEWFVARKKPELAEAFARVRGAVLARYTTPLNLVKAACKVR